MAEQFVPHFPTQPGKFYFVVDCPDTGKPIPFLEDESSGNRPYPRRPLIVLCAHCQMMHEIVVPTIVSLQGGTDFAAWEAHDAEDDRVAAEATVADRAEDDRVAVDAAVADRAADAGVAGVAEYAGVEPPLPAPVRVESPEGNIPSPVIPDVARPEARHDARSSARVAVRQAVFEAVLFLEAAFLLSVRRKISAIATPSIHRVRAFSRWWIATVAGFLAGIGRTGASVGRGIGAAFRWLVALPVSLALGIGRAALSLWREIGVLSRWLVALPLRLAGAVGQAGRSAGRVVATLFRQSVAQVAAFIVAIGRSAWRAVSVTSRWLFALPQRMAVELGRAGRMVWHGVGVTSRWLVAKPVNLADVIGRSAQHAVLVFSRRVIVQTSGVAASLGHARRAMAREADILFRWIAVTIDAAGHAIWRVGVVSRWAAVEALRHAREIGRAASSRVRIPEVARPRPMRRLPVILAASYTALWPAAREAWQRPGASMAAPLRTRIASIPVRDAVSRAPTLLGSAIAATWSRHGAPLILFWRWIQGMWPARAVSSTDSILWSGIAALRSRYGASSLLLQAWIADVWSRVAASVASFAIPLGARTTELWSRLSGSATAILVWAWIKRSVSRHAASLASVAAALWAWLEELGAQYADHSDIVTRAFDVERPPLDRRQLLALRRRAPREQLEFVYRVDSPHSDLVRQSFSLMCAASAMGDDGEIRQQPALGLAEAALKALRRDLGVDADQQIVGLQTIVLALGAVGEPRGPGDPSGALAFENDARGLNRERVFP